MNRQSILKGLGKTFPTVWHNATKFGVNQILMAITLSSISGISRICRIATFSRDGLVKALLKLDKAINENAISATLKILGQSGARRLQMLLLSKNARWLHESKLESITLDADSTVKSVCGNQEGAAKGFNTTKKGAKSYHPLLVFASEMKLLYHTWLEFKHRSFIDWFIAVPAKIAISRHQIESKIANTYKNKQFSEQIKMYENHFYKDAWEELDISTCSIHRRLTEAA